MSEDISSTQFELSQDDYMNPLYDRSTETQDYDVENISPTQNTLQKEKKPVSGKNVSQRSTHSKLILSSNVTQESAIRCCPAVNCPEKIVGTYLISITDQIYQLFNESER